MITLRNAMIAGLSLLCSSVASAGSAPNDIGTITLKLHDGMAEKEVIALVGRTPVSVDEDTCGQNTPNGAWQCRTLNYPKSCSSLWVTERYDSESKSWVVNNWRTWVC
jgi:hypothetical protein